ncbi:hypothetical protein [Bartonella sp. B1098]|nr:hypothetical protein [Bartonella sp. B1098]
MSTKIKSLDFSEPDESQINIKTSIAIINRFKSMAKQERYRHGDF